MGLFTKEQNAVSTENSLSEVEIDIQKTDIPLKITKENIDIISHFLYYNFNNSLSCSTFPTGIKYAEVTPIYKKDDKTER